MKLFFDLDLSKVIAKATIAIATKVTSEQVSDVDAQPMFDAMLAAEVPRPIVEVAPRSQTEVSPINVPAPSIEILTTPSKIPTIKVISVESLIADKDLFSSSISKSEDPQAKARYYNFLSF